MRSILIAVLAIAAPIPVGAKVAAEPMGKDIADRCKAYGLQYCSGYIDGIHAFNAARAARRRCPPPIATTQAPPDGVSPMTGQVLSYLQHHPEAVSRPARDVVFDVESDGLGRCGLK